MTPAAQPPTHEGRQQQHHQRLQLLLAHNPAVGQGALQAGAQATQLQQQRGCARPAAAEGLQQLRLGGPAGAGG
jgi:hypothetical protein